MDADREPPPAEMGLFRLRLRPPALRLGGGPFKLHHRQLDVYDPHRHAWDECLFCIEWRNQRALVVFNPAGGRFLAEDPGAAYGQIQDSVLRWGRKVLAAVLHGGRSRVPDAHV
jgi:hypothetical protein